MTTENPAAAGGNEAAPTTERFPLEGSRRGHGDVPGDLHAVLRGREAALAHIATAYPWLAFILTPDGLYRLARDIMFEGG